jgi:hypothetical protein
MTDNRNIIVVKEEIKFFQNDQYASPQNVFHIPEDTAAILTIIENNTPQIINNYSSNRD